MAGAAKGLKSYFPVFDWAPRYNARLFTEDALAAAIVTIMLIPQSLAYALMAGMPAQTGLYASIAPLLVYAALGVSASQAVGPVAITSLMTATAAGRFVANGADPVATTVTLAFLVGALFFAFGLLRLGFIANFLSRPIISGFSTASGVLIAADQFGHILGVKAQGDSIIDVLTGLWRKLGETNLPTLYLGLAVLAFLLLARLRARKFLIAIGIPEWPAALAARAAPLIAVVGSIIIVKFLGLNEKGVAVLGPTPRGLPHLTAPIMDFHLWMELFRPALLIAIISYVQTISVARTFAARSGKGVNPDQELISLGAANIASGATGAFPVAVRLSRSVVNVDAGAKTPAVSAYVAVGVALAAMYLTPYLYFLPKAALAATIIIAALSLVDLGAIKRTLKFSKADFAAIIATILGVFLLGVEAGLTAGVFLSILLLLHRASRPHSAIVGQVPGTEHFRNIIRHDVLTSPIVASIRIDGDLFFGNAGFVEEKLLGLARENPQLKHIVLMASAINSIDSTALEAIETVNMSLRKNGVTLHFADVKGPVMGRLKRSNFLDRLTGKIFLSEFEAMHQLDPDTFRRPAPATGVSR